MLSIPNIQKRLEELMVKHAIAVEELTGQQLAEAVRQACACGDFCVHVIKTDMPDHLQKVVYLPYARQEELLDRIRRLEDALKVAGVADPDRDVDTD